MARPEDDDKFDIGKIPYLQKMLGDTQTDDSVTPEGHPLEMLAGPVADSVARAATPLLMSAGEAAAPMASKLMADEAGKFEVPALQRMLKGGATLGDDAASALVPNPKVNTSAPTPEKLAANQQAMSAATNQMDLNRAAQAANRTYSQQQAAALQAAKRRRFGARD